ncbi:MAG: ParA family protein [Spirochaetota bacterium]
MTDQKYLIPIAELAELLNQPIDLLAKQVDSNECIALPGNKIGIPANVVRSVLKNVGVDYSPRIISFSNLKGGIGKTTSAISVATRAMQYGFKTCIIDMDSQASASQSFGAEPEADEAIFYDVWQKPQEHVMPSLKKIRDNLYLLPSSLENGLLDSALVSPASQKNAVRAVCDVLKNNGFEAIIIDCPPSLGTAVISTICASDTIVIPVCHDMFSFKGLKLTLAEISAIVEAFGLLKPSLRILYTKYDRRLSLSETSAKKLMADFKEEFIPTPIRTNSIYAKALEKRETIFASSNKHPAKIDYDLCFQHLFGWFHILNNKTDSIIHEVESA